MIFSEPQRTAYDLNFSLGNTPVRVNPIFWLIAALPAAQGEKELVPFLLWVAVVFFSIVVHEMGHALAFRYFGWHSHIVLYSFGGLAIPDASYGSRVQTPQSRMIISLAGPVAGFLLAGVVVLTLFVIGYRFDFKSPISFLNFEAGRGPWISNIDAARFVDDLLSVNICWGLVNLLPVYPLDGGQFFREVLMLVNPRDGVRQSLILSIGTGIAMAVFSYSELGSSNGFYCAAMFGYLAYMSYAALQSLGGFGGRNW